MANFMIQGWLLWELLVLPLLPPFCASWVLLVVTPDVPSSSFWALEQLTAYSWWDERRSQWVVLYQHRFLIEISPKFDSDSGRSSTLRKKFDSLGEIQLFLLLLILPVTKHFGLFLNVSENPQIILLACSTTFLFQGFAFSLGYPKFCNVPQRLVVCFQRAYGHKWQA